MDAFSILAIGMALGWLVIFTMMFVVRRIHKQNDLIRANRDGQPIRPGPQPKRVPPFPFGPISDLIKDAEARAEREFFELFPEERPKPDPGSPPGGYSMDSSPDGIIISNSVMTPNEWRERYMEKFHYDPVMILDENTTYRSLTNPPKMIDVPTLDKPYRRYIQGIGIITADSEWKLERACEVAVREKLGEYEKAMRSLDARIRSSMGVPRPEYTAELKEERREAWEKCKLYLGLLEELNL